MSKFDGLTDFLAESIVDRVVLTFEEVNALVNGDLPESAFKHRPWWANRTEGRGSQNLAWQSIGWETRDVDMDLDEVTFVRVRPKVEAVVAAKQIGLTISEAKAGLAKMFGVSEDQIEISIRA
ncbi:MAG: hypothetical protein C0517_09550 [Erythrobacter sp.]|nr:hypothetical protein [Erythrobacter sp.]